MNRSLAVFLSLVLSSQLLGNQNRPSGEDCENNSILPLILKRTEGGKVAEEYRGGVHEVGIKTDRKVYVSHKKNSSSPVEVVFVQQISKKDFKKIKKLVSHLKALDLVPSGTERCTDLPTISYIAAALDGKEFVRRQSCIDYLPSDPQSKSAALELKSILDKISSTK